MSNSPNLQNVSPFSSTISKYPCWFFLSRIDLKSSRNTFWADRLRFCLFLSYWTAWCSISVHCWHLKLVPVSHLIENAHALVVVLFIPPVFDWVWDHNSFYTVLPEIVKSFKVNVLSRGVRCVINILIHAAILSKALQLRCLWLCKLALCM